MRVLITGAAGFIGGALASRLLRDGHAVTAFVRDGEPPVGCRTVWGDLRDLHSIERALVSTEPEAVFHLAAQAYVPVARRDPWSTLEDNVRGTYNLLEGFWRHASGEASLVVASSDKAYGDMPPVGPPGTYSTRAYRESDPMDGRGPYDASKSCADLIARSYAEQYGLRAAVVRCGNVYGPGDDGPSRLVPSVVADLLRNREVQLTSDGSPVRDYLYVDDAVEAYLAVDAYLRGLPLSRVISDTPYPPLRAFNFSGGEAVSVRELVTLASEVALEVGLPPSPGARYQGSRTGEIPAQVLNWSLAANVLHWMPRVTLHEGLRRTLLAGLVPRGQGPLQSEKNGGGGQYHLPPKNTPGHTPGGL